MDVGIKSNGSIHQGQRGATQPTVLALYQWLQRKLELMHPPMVWEQFSCRRTPAGGQSSILPDPCLQLKCSMLKLRKRPSLQHVRVSTDHKPLVCQKNLDSLPPTILRFRLCLARFDYTIANIPGKELCVADTLSQHQLLK